ncbi:MAG: phytanoyl-CoA dioxygenase family protein [Sphingomonas sp.]
MKKALAEELRAAGCWRQVGFFTEVELREMAPLFLDHTRAAGSRPTVSAVAGFSAVVRVVDLVGEMLGTGTRVIRALALNKSPDANWTLGWHQDRVIEVARQADAPGFGRWTQKAGRPHVAPPFAVLAQMVTARLHLDAVDEGNAPLLVLPGSHQLGIVDEPDIGSAVGAGSPIACLADAGDVWLYATPILHASRPAASPHRRRVLQIDMSAQTLPGSLEWAPLGEVAGADSASNCGRSTVSLER